MQITANEPNTHWDCCEPTVNGSTGRIPPELSVKDVFPVAISETQKNALVLVYAYRKNSPNMFLTRFLYIGQVDLIIGNFFVSACCLLFLSNFIYL